MSRPVTAEQAVQFIDMLQMPPVTQQRIRQWAHRGKVTKLGAGRDGKMRYELHDIIALAEAHRDRGEWKTE